MTREAKLSLLVGLAFIVLFGYILSNKGPARRPAVPEYFMAGTSAEQASQPGGLQAGRREVGEFAEASTLQRELEDQPPSEVVSAEQSALPQAPLEAAGLRTEGSIVRPVDDAAKQRAALPRVDLPQPATGLDEAVEWLEATVAWSAVEPMLEGSEGSPTATPTERSGEKPGVAGLEGPAGGQPAGRHVVVKGDTLSEIAQRRLGSGSPAAVRRLMEANPFLKSPDVIALGSVLIIPPLEDWALAKGPANTEKPPATMLVHSVQPNDSLVRLAEHFLGSKRAWREIYELNKSSIKNPNLLLVGQKLKIPVRGTGGSGRS